MSIFPDILRSLVTDIMLILLLYTLTRPKYHNKYIYIAATLIMIVINFSCNMYFYLQDDYTSVFIVDLCMLIIIAITFKPLFSDSIMQWCFSYITMLNIYVSILFLSYTLSDFFYNPMYGNTCLRFIFFSLVILLFSHVMSPVYQKVVDYWYVFILPALALLVNFLYYLLGGNIEAVLSENIEVLLLLIILGTCIYTAILLSLRAFAKHYELREEHFKTQNDKKLLQLSTNALEQRLILMDDLSKKMSVANHDRRHFNHTLLAMLQQEQLQEAVDLLKQQDTILPSPPKPYCENIAVNASVNYYISLAKKEDIACRIQMDIPAKLEINSLELAMALSNLLENAINSCKNIESIEKRYINLTALYTGQLIIEIENPYVGEIILDENGYPISTSEGHGIGTKSILALVCCYEGDVIYKIANGIFKIRILL